MRNLACAVEGCDRTPRGQLCPMHRRRLKVHGHVTPWLLSPQARFWNKVPRMAVGDCWEWQGAADRHGYGKFRVGSTRDGSRRMEQAHRWAYETLIGTISDGLVLDHLCRNPRCVNPHHLEPVTQGENVRRGEGWPGQNARATHCPKGHPYDEQNTYQGTNGGRCCRTCHRESARAARVKIHPHA